jgi:hypothetical protein
MDNSCKTHTPSRSGSDFDLDALLHPAGAFAHPMDVVRDADLTLNEKRAILASWASDACAVEAVPDLRTTPSGKTVRWDDIMDALRLLDTQSLDTPRPSRAKWHRWRRWRQPPDGEAGHGAQPG